MTSKQLKILNEILNQRKDEVKKLEEFVKEWEIREMDLERQYQEKHKVYSFFFCFFPLFFFPNIGHFFVCLVLIERPDYLLLLIYE